eukprot:TRINITY_DN4657_c0_g2_i1.p1 TRINITY_DN4657_c0_g2~~TRINITY_DN4657_c0_g2_i1.p1  ORF type:complete len:377 (+),score=63.89 TRINITY_DN4657_c0_g2_i1:62-1192(+)
MPVKARPGRGGGGGGGVVPARERELQDRAASLERSYMLCLSAIQRERPDGVWRVMSVATTLLLLLCTAMSVPSERQLVDYLAAAPARRTRWKGTSTSVSSGFDPAKVWRGAVNAETWAGSKVVSYRGGVVFATATVAPPPRPGDPAPERWHLLGVWQHWVPIPGAGAASMKIALAVTVCAAVGYMAGGRRRRRHLQLSPASVRRPWSFVAALFGVPMAGGVLRVTMCVFAIVGSGAELEKIAGAGVVTVAYTMFTLVGAAAGLLLDVAAAKRSPKRRETEEGCAAGLAPCGVIAMQTLLCVCTLTVQGQGLVEQTLHLSGPTLESPVHRLVVYVILELVSAESTRHLIPHAAVGLTSALTALLLALSGAVANESPQ